MSDTKKNENKATKNSNKNSKSFLNISSTVPRQDPPVQLGDVLTSNQGVKLSDNHNSLKAGPRGPTLLEDFILREKITSFDHERIPERAVHARGAGAFGYFECTEDMSKFTSADFLNEVGKKTPVLVRFSTVAGNRGSMDTARDVRGFSVKFYTDEGNYDLVGNNIPVFFIQDAIKFPDLVHAVKPEQNNEIPQASSAHDTFWDFISLMPESLHMIMWTMSDRAIPRSYRMMEGFGVHTFRFVNTKGEATFVKFHWKPALGVHGLVWEESQMLGGLDPDYHRRDLWESIEKGYFPEWELGVQLIPEKDEFKFPFDLLDSTKLVPEELVPVRKIGKLVLDCNPDNYFSEIEQAAFHPGHVVSGIDFTNDPLLQGRLFSYTDTQLTRLGGPNFHELPVNRPLANVHNHQRDGFGRQSIPKGRIAYEPNSLAGGCPFHAGADPQAFVHYTERMSGHKVRARSESFSDHFSQARLFFNSQTDVEKNHIKDALVFELSKVETSAIRERMIQNLFLVNENLAAEVAGKLGIKLPKKPVIPPNPADASNNIVPNNRSMPYAKEDQKNIPSQNTVTLPIQSKALSMILSSPKKVMSRKVALLISPSTASDDIEMVTKMLETENIMVEFIVPKPNIIDLPMKTPDQEKTLASTPSHSYDAVFSLTALSGYETPKDKGLALRFIGQAFKHCKTLASNSAGQELIHMAASNLVDHTDGLFIATEKKSLKKITNYFIDGMREHRHWSREDPAKILPY
ncbi:MAG: catalase [Pseudomonadota bacterium]